MSAVIAFEDVTLGYDRHPAVHHLSGEVPAGALLAIVGPNGAGKSTLLKGIVGELKPLSGRIRRADARRRDTAYLPQQSELDRSFPISVFDLVAMGNWGAIGSLGSLGGTGRRRVASALEEVGLEGFDRRQAGTLSRGQLQRALFARLLVQDAPLILLDEPFTALDQRTEQDLLALVARWHGEGRTVLAVMHDLDTVRARFPRTLLLARDPVAWGETGEVMTNANLLRARSISEAWDEAAPRCESPEIAA
jgi:zinc/manganese transport system ATP-binding protein